VTSSVCLLFWRGREKYYYATDDRNCETVFMVDDQKRKPFRTELRPRRTTSRQRRRRLSLTLLHTSFVRPFYTHH